MYNGGGLETVLKLIVEKALVNIFFQKKGLVDLKCSQESLHVHCVSTAANTIYF